MSATGPCCPAGASRKGGHLVAAPLLTAPPLPQTRPPCQAGGAPVRRSRGCLTPGAGTWPTRLWFCHLVTLGDWGGGHRGMPKPCRRCRLPRVPWPRASGVGGREAEDGGLVLVPLGLAASALGAAAGVLAVPPPTPPTLALPDSRAAACGFIWILVLGFRANKESISFSAELETQRQKSCGGNADTLCR